VSSPDDLQSPGQIEQWIAGARQGSREALGKILEAFRPYLLLIGNESLNDDLQAKVGASDLVQETFLKAQCEFKQFRGDTEKELKNWLGQIMRNNLANARRHHLKTDKRQVEREIALTDTPLIQLLNGLVDPGKTPSERILGQERDQALRTALGKLSTEYREVIQLRIFDNCSLKEVGLRMNRSADAARKLFARAIDLLAQTMEWPDVPG
jgi:RNA polymerase sigma-70 factor (ECF subfamily)